MKQVLIIHGGDSFSTYDNYIEYLKNKQLDYERLKYRTDWKPWIAEKLTGGDVLTPTFPNGTNAMFNEWEIYFEKILPFLHDDVSLVGHSLGGMFLAKYFQNKTLQTPVRNIILIAPRYGDHNDDGSFAVESAVNLSKSTHEVHLFHSKDDPVVSYESLDKFCSDLPSAIVHRFEKRGHFNDATFPELLELFRQK